jgi:hypothetical protein
MMHVVALLQTFLNRRDWMRLFALSLFSFVVSLLETFCLSAIMPFLFLAVGTDQPMLKQFSAWLPHQNTLPGSTSLRRGSSSVLAVLFLKIICKAHIRITLLGIRPRCLR